MSRLINSAISKRLRNQRKHSLFEKKNTALKGKEIHHKHLEKSHHLMDHAMKQSTRQFQKIFFSHLKMFSMNAEKTLQLKITKKE